MHLNAGIKSGIIVLKRTVLTYSGAQCRGSREKARRTCRATAPCSSIAVTLCPFLDPFANGWNLICPVPDELLRCSVTYVKCVAVKSAQDKWDDSYWGSLIAMIAAFEAIVGDLPEQEP